MMSPYILLHALTCAVYAGLALHFWSTRWLVKPAAPPPGGEAPKGGLKGWERAVILLPLAMHGWLLYTDLVAPAHPHFGFAHALSAMLWLAVFFYWIESFFYNLEGLQGPVLGLAAVTAPLPAFFPGYDTMHDASLEFKLHIVLAMLAYSLFTIAILHAILMAVVERRLHGSRKGAMAPGEPLGPLRGFASLPPLLTLERLLFRLIGVGFVLLTATLVTGIIFSDSLFGKPLRFDHKSVFAVISWFTFAGLLVGRHFYGWRGRTALRWTLAGFVLLLLAYIGSRFVLEVVLGRGAT